jgi:phenylacetate-CoA ligase
VLKDALSEMLAYAAKSVPYYSQQEWAANLRAGLEVPFDEIPLTPKQDVRSQTEAFYGYPVPKDHGAIISKTTSGSTGEPMVIRMTQLHHIHNAGENRRLKRPWGLSEMSGFIATNTPNHKHPPKSVAVSAKNFRSSAWRIYSYDPEPVLELLGRTRAEVLVSRPSAIEAVLERVETESSLKAVCSIGEVVTDSLRQQIGRFPGLTHVDIYGSVETGIMACLCVSCGAYHIANQHLILEVLGDDGKPVANEETGRVVVTTLFNAAMPLIRYEIGDYAVMARGLSCKMSHDGLLEIAGRTLNLFNLPDGRRITPKLNNDDLRALGIRRCKMIQVELLKIEFLYETNVSGATVSAEAIQRLVDLYISPLIRAVPVCVERIHSPASGKYLLHENRISSTRNNQP